MSISSLSDNELFQKIQKSDTRALEVLYNRYSPLLYPMINKITENEELTETVICDLFILIWKRASMLDVNSLSPFTWIITLAKNKANDAKKRIQSPEYDQFPYDDFYEEMYILPQIVNSGIPIDFATARELKKNVEKALEGLTEAQEHVLLLALYGGMTNQEIADNLNIPLETVNSKIEVALESLNKNLDLGNIGI